MIDTKIRMILKRNFDNDKYQWSKAHKEVQTLLADEIAMARESVVETIEKQIAIHNQLEEEWTGISIIPKRIINPHTERKEELQIILSSLNNKTFS